MIRRNAELLSWLFLLPAVITAERVVYDPRPHPKSNVTVGACMHVLESHGANRVPEQYFDMRH